MSPRTGIMFNDEMDDFSFPDIINDFGLPPSPNNFAKPGNRPLSSMSPAIFVDSAGDLKLVIGATGGTYITSARALRSICNLHLGWEEFGRTSNTSPAHANESGLSKRVQ